MTAEIPKRQPRPANRDDDDSKPNLAGFGAGIVLTGTLIWSLYNGYMDFAYLNVVLLTVLAVGTHYINRKYN